MPILVRGRLIWVDGVVIEPLGRVFELFHFSVPRSGGLHR
jgi:hypothetical protein